MLGFAALAQGRFSPDSEAPTPGPAGPLTEVDLPSRRSEWHGSFDPKAAFALSAFPHAAILGAAKTGSCAECSWASSAQIVWAQHGKTRGVSGPNAIHALTVRASKPT